MDNVQLALRDVGANWKWMLVYGILLILVGFMAYMNPLATSLAVGILLSASFCISGAASLIAAFRDAGWQNKMVDVLFGALALLAGFICFVNPFGGAISLVWVIGITFIILGTYEVSAGLRSNHEKGWLITLGIIDMLLGLWAAFFMGPAAALVALTALVGFGFIMRGVMIATFALRVRKIVA